MKLIHLWKFFQIGNIETQLTSDISFFFHFSVPNKHPFHMKDSREGIVMGGVSES